MPSAQSRRRVLVLADQAASSLSNVLVAILVARSFPDETEPFAAFSLAVMVFQFTVGSVRGLIFEPELLLHGERSRHEARRILPSYLSATGLVGVAVSVAVAGTSVVVGGLAGAALLALSLVLPFILVQDAWRYVFMTVHPGKALTIDLVWVATSCTAIVLVPNGSAIGWYVVAWGAGGLLGAIVATVIGEVEWGRVRPVRYLVAHRSLGVRFLGEFATAQTGYFGALLSCGWILGLNAYGAVRGGFLYIGPLQMLAAGVLMATLPEARKARDDPDRVLTLVRGGNALVCLATVVWVSVGLVLPESVGEALIGATWNQAREVLVPLGITMIGMSIVSAALVGVRAFDGTQGLRTRLQSIPFQLLCPIAGAYLGGLDGFVIGMALGQAVGAGIWWTTFRRLLAGAHRSTARHLAGDGREPRPAPPDVAAFVLADDAPY